MFSIITCFSVLCHLSSARAAQVYPELKARLVPVLDIVPPPPSMWELRIIIYEVDGIMPTDGGMDCSGARSAERENNEFQNYW